MASGRVDMVKLQSSDGAIFEVSLKVAKVSRTLATMLDDLGHHPSDVIPLPNVDSTILKKVLAWAEHHIRVRDEGEITTSPQAPPLPASPTPSTPSPVAPPLQPRPQPRIPQRPSRRVQIPQSHTLTQWEKDFITKNRDDVYNLLLAANYLDIKGLLDILCSAVAEMIKGKDPDQIRRTFNASHPSQLPTDTPEQSPVHTATPSPSQTHTEFSVARKHKETAV